MQRYARVTASRKNITLELPKKYHTKFSPFNMITLISELITNDNHKIISNKIDENIIFNKNNLQPVQYKHFRELQYFGTIYKQNQYLTEFLK